MLCMVLKLVQFINWKFHPHLPATVMNTTYKHQNTENHFLLLYPFQKEPNQNCQTNGHLFFIHHQAKVLMYSLSQLVCSKHLLFAYYSLRNSVSVKRWIRCFNHANEYITIIPLFSNPNHLLLIPLTLTMHHSVALKQNTETLETWAILHSRYF